MSKKKRYKTPGCVDASELEFERTSDKDTHICDLDSKVDITVDERGRIIECEGKTIVRRLDEKGKLKTIES